MATTAAAASMFGTSRFCPATITTFSCSSKRMQSVRFFTDHFLGLSRSIPTRLIDFPPLLNTLRRPTKPIMDNALQNQKPNSSLFVKGFAVSLAVLASTAAFTSGAAAFAAEIPSLGSSSLQFQEPSNALSLPTWAIHVSSVVEWITAMVLVWQYGEKSGYQSWKGLSWGMVPLLGGAFCACTWHFFYNSESLEVLVAIQAALTVIGNFTMCIAAFRIYKASQEGSENA